MRRLRVFSRIGMIVLLFLVPAYVSRAAIITYAPPALPGTNVAYVAVSESSGTDPVPLYGTPTVSGNNLIFSNMNFSASSISGAPASDFTDGQLNFTVQANPGGFIQSIQWQESGDYNVTNFPNLASVNSAKIFSQVLQITVLDINGVALGSPLTNNTSVAMNLTPNGGTYITGVTPPTGSWQGIALANLTALFGSNQITKVAISYDNQLAASSQAGGIATISKKSVIITPGLVPEPMSLSLAGMAAAVLLTGRRRTSRV